MSILGIQLQAVVGGIRRSLDFPEIYSVSPDLHQGTSILVTDLLTGQPGAFFPNNDPNDISLINYQYNNMWLLYLNK